MPRAVHALAGVAAAAAMLLAACGGKDGRGEDRPNVDVIQGEGGSASVSGAVEGYGELLYTPSTDQAVNLAIGLDLRDMRSLMAPAGQGRNVDWEKVAALYNLGSNQVLPGGAKRSLSAVARETAAASVFPDAPAVHGRPDFVHAMVQQALTGVGRANGLSDNSRRQIVDKGVQVLMYAKALEHLQSAAALMQGGKQAEAPASVDAAWASISGARDTATTTPNNGVLATALAREEDFGFQGKIARPLEASLSSAQAAAERNDRAGFDKAVADSRAYMNTTFYLSVLRFAKLAAIDARSADREAHLAEGWSSFQALRSSVAAASPDAAQAVETAFTRPGAEPFPATVTAAIYGALNQPAVLEALRVPPEFQVKAPQ